MSLWCLVPAAGRGTRMGTHTPKQYLSLAERPLLAWTLEALLALSPRALVLVVAPQDDRARDLAGLDPRVETVPNGGAERAHSVLAGLEHLDGRAANDDWVLVHDAARPCLDPALARRLLTAIADHPVGGLLALPVADTVKQAAAGDGAPCVEATLDRRALWLAQTPQVFRFAALREALAAALAAGTPVTDEASAMEAAGQRPLLVEGSAANLKVTRAEDLPLAAFWLGRRMEESP